jgi:rSAM/selenodomain-associated transferase 2
MRVSVVVPALNEEPGIAAAVSSARSFGAAEVIVVDGGSQDATCRIAAEAGAEVLSSLPGRAVQQNAGAVISSGEVLLFLHADCRLPSGGVEQIEAALEDPAVVGGSFRQRIEDRGWLYRWLERGNAWRAGWRQVPYGDQGLFVRRASFEAAGGFPEVPLMDDVMLARSLRRLGRLKLVEGPLEVDARRWQQRGVIRQTLRNWCLLTAWRLGVSPERLAEHYRRHDRDVSLVGASHDRHRSP